MIRTDRSILVPPALLALCIVPVVAGISRLASLVAGEPSAESVRFFDAPLPAALHILAVVPYSILGALQFIPALRVARGTGRPECS
jgi:hypothetical protein